MRSGEVIIFGASVSRFIEELDGFLKVDANGLVNGRQLEGLSGVRLMHGFRKGDESWLGLELVDDEEHEVFAEREDFVVVTTKLHLKIESGKLQSRRESLSAFKGPSMGKAKVQEAKGKNRERKTWGTEGGHAYLR